MIKVFINETDRHSAEIVIRDSGVGIPESQLPKLFDRFYQVDHSHTRKYEGSELD